MNIEKSLLKRFVNKYYLNKVNDEHQTVVFECKDDKIEINLKPQEHDFVRIKTVLNRNFGEEIDFAIMKTSKLLSTIDILDENISLELEKKNDIPMKLKIKSEELIGNLTLGDKDIVNRPEKIKIDVNEIPYNLEVTLDSTFMSKFIKASSTFSDKNYFTIHNNKTNTKNLLTIGYDSKNNSDAFSFELGNEFVDLENGKLIDFSATYLSSIFSANKEFDYVTFKMHILPNYSNAVVVMHFSDSDIDTLYLLSALSIHN